MRISKSNFGVLWVPSWSCDGRTTRSCSCCMFCSVLSMECVLITTYIPSRSVYLLAPEVRIPRQIWMEPWSQRCVALLHQVAVANILPWNQGYYRNFGGKIPAIIEGFHVNAQVNQSHLTLVKLHLRANQCIRQKAYNRHLRLQMVPTSSFSTEMRSPQEPQVLPISYLQLVPDPANIPVWFCRSLAVNGW